MKTINRIITFLFTGCLMSSCNDFLDPNEYALLTEDKLFTINSYVTQIPFGIYGCVPMNTSDGVNFSAITDEAEQVDNTSALQTFNNGTWNKYVNPDSEWSSCYKGIRIACDYLQATDTLTWSNYRYSNPAKYATMIRDLCIGRAEARFLRAYLYLELIKRYGDVPLITDKLAITPEMDFSKFTRTAVGEIIDYISDQCDVVCREGKYYRTPEEIATETLNGRKLLPPLYRDTLLMAYPGSGELAPYLGRATRASAYALKAKALVYYASKQFNPEGDVERWKRAAEACKKVLDLPKASYGLEPIYADLFSKKNNWSKEFLFVRKAGASNAFEKSNYPVSIEGGNTGLCPSQNLVDAYEVLEQREEQVVAVPFDWNNVSHRENPYENRDPRFSATIYRHGEQYSSSVNTIVLNCMEGGNSALPIYHATKTGYYLKKYINPVLDLKNNKTDSKTWILMRMADFYLYYAEAMNEAYGPSNSAALGMTALQAVNAIRQRAGMPDIITNDRNVLREKIYNERRVELAFENQRWWDVRRWQYGQAFNNDLQGVRITLQGEKLVYSLMAVEKRVFDESKMYLYPIPQSEIDKSGGALVQNVNW